LSQLRVSGLGSPPAGWNRLRVASFCA